MTDKEDARMDQAKLRMFSYLVFTKLEGAVTSGMIHLGDKLGLYRAMKNAAVPLQSSELAERTGLHERCAEDRAVVRVVSTTFDATPNPIVAAMVRQLHGDRSVCDGLLAIHAT